MEQLANTMGDFMEAVGDFQKNALEPTLRDLNSLAKSFKENETLIKIVGGGMMVLAGAFVMMVSGGAIRLVVGLFMALGRQVKVLVGVLPKLSKGFTGLIGKIFGKKGFSILEKSQLDSDSGKPMFDKGVKDSLQDSKESAESGFTKNPKRLFNYLMKKN